MKSFAGIKSLDTLLKSAQVEVLLSDIMLDQANTLVHPSNCPGKGRVNDFLTDQQGNSACAAGTSKCKYFVGAAFSLEDYTKIIQCSVGNNDKEKSEYEEKAK